MAGLLVPALLVGAAGCASGGRGTSTQTSSSTAGAASASAPAQAPAAPDPVALTAEGAPTTLTLGVVVSPGASETEGSAWVGPAQGAAVAAYRYQLGGTTVTLVTVDDHGTSEGAQAAVEDLAAQSVSGIVMATSGSHLAAALEAAASRSIPVLLPYEASSDLLTTDDAGSTDAGSSGTGGTGSAVGAWITGPTLAQTGTALVKALREAGSSAPLLIDAGGGAPTGLEPVQVVGYTDGEDTTALTTAVTAATESRSVDAVVVSGPAHAQATVVRALQGTGTTLPVLLTPQALSPAFPAALAEAGGSLAMPLTTVGAADCDPSALTPTDDGSALSAYLAAVRMMSEDPAVLDVLDGQPFGESAAASADVASHDAVVALVRAAAKAGGTDPAAVGEALRTLSLDHDDGLAGGALDLTSPTALSSGAVVTLDSTNQDPGLRTAARARPLLYWFAPQG